jgi:putative ABC transport system ATP-binding protein
MDTPVIEINDLTKEYGEEGSAARVRALSGVDVTIQPEEFVAIMGPSGSGKSTLMNLIGCLDRPTSGTYLLHGEDVSQLDRAARARVRNESIGFIFQSYNLLARTSALKNVALPMIYDRAHHTTEAERLERAQKTLEAVGLGDRTHHQPHELSGGQQQRVAVARALINDPKLILADEPTGNLDTAASLEIIALLKELNDRGRTIVMVTHEPDMAALCKRVIYLRDGRIEVDRKNGAGKAHAPAKKAEEETRKAAEKEVNHEPA